MERRVFFRADASPQLGGGHIRRCLVLADVLRTAGWDCTFAVAAGSVAVVPLLARSDHRVIEISIHDSCDLSAFALHDFDLAVIDHYGLGAEFEQKCRAWAKRILVIDDLANRPHDCDILLDATLGRTEGAYRSLVSASTALLLGPRFALLESRFFARRMTLRDPMETVGAAFVSFGTVDSADLSSKAVIALRAAGMPIKIDVAVGAASPNIRTLQEMADDDVSPARIVVDSDDMSALMAAAAIAIGAGGVTSWERCCLGLPSLIVTVADNQKEGASTLDRAGAAKWLGSVGSLSDDQLRAAVKSLIEDHTGRAAMRAAALTITDGLGARRVVSAVEDPVRAKDGLLVTLRPAGPDDCEMMFAWQTAPGARKYSRNPQPFRYEEHREWFRRKLADPKCVFNIAMHDGKPAGILRYDGRAEQAFEVSILVSADHQRRGIASTALTLGRRLLPDAVVTAEVDPANLASASLFTRAGYRRIDERRYILAPGDASPTHHGLPAA